MLANNYNCDEDDTCTRRRVDHLQCVGTVYCLQGAGSKNISYRDFYCYIVMPML
jgi:hypothetical protein